MKRYLVALIGMLTLVAFVGCSQKTATQQEAKEIPATKKAASKSDKKPVVDKETGLIVAPGFEEVKANCLACHSSAFITSNKGDKRKWKEMIVWMQQTQGLWDLGENEPIILEYLSTNYAPTKVYRRPPLKIEWKN